MRHRPSALASLAVASLLVALLLPASAAVAAPPKTPTILTISAAPDPVFVGDPVTLTFTVTPTPDGGDVWVWGHHYPVDPATGTASVVLTAGFGDTPIEAYYVGTELFAPSPLAEYTIDIIRHDVVITLDVPDEPIGQGDPFEVTIDVDEVPPDGEVFIERTTDGESGPLLTRVQLDGTNPVTVELAGMEPGDYDLRARFPGTGAYEDAMSAVQPLEVFARVAVGTLTLEPESPDWGEPTTATIAFDPIPDDGGAVKLVVDGDDAGWFEMDWETGLGSVDVPWLLPGTYELDVVYIPAVWPPRWSESTDAVELAVSTTPVDGDPPVGWVSIDGGAAVTQLGSSVISMHAEDASMIHEVEMSCDAVTWTSAGAVSGDWFWGWGNESCDPNDGIKTMIVRWTDMYGNAGLASDTILLDHNGPLGAAVIDDGALYTDAVDVSVSVVATDAGSAVTHVALSNDGTTWTTRAYAPATPWTLAAAPVATGDLTAETAATGQGLRKVYVKWRDARGHWSPPTSDTITLDSQAPTGAPMIMWGARHTKTPLVTVTTAATDGGSGPVKVALSNDGVTWTTRTYAPLQAWTLPSIQGTRTIHVKWLDGAGHWSAVKTDTIILDTVAPTAGAPGRALVAGTAIDASDGIQTRIAWTGADATAGIGRYELARSTDGGPWTTVSTTLSSPSWTGALGTNRYHRFRVRPVDQAGNVGAWVQGDQFRLTRRHEGDPGNAYTKTWSTSKASSHWGGASRYSRSSAATTTFTFTGRSLAWVASTGPDRGKAEVFVNGVKVATVDLKGSTLRTRRVVWAGAWATSVSRTITIKVLATTGRPRVDLDAWVTAG